MRQLNEQELNAVSGGETLNLFGLVEIDLDPETNVFDLNLDGDLDFNYDLTPIKNFLSKFFG